MRAPALLPALSLMIGVASQPVQALGSETLLKACALAVVLFLVSRRRSRMRVATLCLACACAGGALCEREYLQRSSDLDRLFQGATHYQGSIEGRVSDRLFTDGDGQRWLTLEGNRPGQTRANLPFRLLIEGSHAPPLLLEGDFVRVWCRIKRSRADRGIQSILGAVKSPSLIELQAQSHATPKPWRWRSAAERRLERLPPSDTEARTVVQAMIFGRGQVLSAPTRRSLRDAGLMHLTAVSGLHVGMVLGALLWTMLRCGVRPRHVAPLLILIGLLFAAGLGGRPSVARAACAAAAISAGRAIGRDGTPINTLALVAGALVALQPSVLMDIGFQLSFTAVAGILGLSVPIAQRLKLPPLLSTAAAVSIAAYVATLPLVALHFSRVAPISVISNLFATPLAAIILAGGYGSVLLADVPWIARPLVAAADLAARSLIDISETLAAHPASAWAVVRPAIWQLPVWGAALAGCGCGRSPITRICPSVLIALSLWLHIGQPPKAPGRPVVTLIDVGQGSSTLLQSPEGPRLLIDAGGRSRGGFDPGERQVLPHLVAEGGLRLDVLALSHGHADHAGGAFALLRELDIDELWVPTGAHRHGRIVALQSAAVDTGVAVRLVEFDERLVLGSIPLRILGPQREPMLGINDQSLTILAGRAPTGVLIPGDLEEAGELALLQSGADLRASLLVLSHHGSRHGTAEALLERVGPEIAAVSVGRGNAFHHPHDETLGRLTQRRIPLHRTDLEGSLTFRLERARWRRVYALE